MRSFEKRLLREYVRKSLREEFGDYGGVTPWSMGYGGSSKSSKSSSGYGTPGNSLYSIFIDPFVQAAKVVGAELGQVGVRVVALASKAIETALDALVPGFQANYDKIDKIERKYLQKIKEKYKPAYEAVADNWDHPDIQLFAFMHSPTTWLTYKAITSKPEAALSVYDAISEGSNTLSLYLRDIRNRLFGASVPGAGLYGNTTPMPVKSENFRRSLKHILRENGEIVKKINFQNLEILIDRPKGFIQTGINKQGDEWERKYLYDYGFIKGTEGGDGEDLDVFVGNDKNAVEAYIVTQNHSDGTFDEYKAFIGFNSVDEVLEAYEAHIPIEYFHDISVIPLGVLKGMLGLNPIAEAKPARVKKTPGEQLADILTSKQFQNAIMKLPIVQQMKKDAAAIESQSTSTLKSAMTPILSAQSAADLAAASNGAWTTPPEYAQLEPDEKKIFDDTVVKQVKASMATYYESRLTSLLKQASETGINDQSPYVASIRHMITSLEPVKQAAKSGVEHAQEKGRDVTNTTGRAQSTGKPSGGVHKASANDRSGNRSVKDGSKGTSGRIQGKTGSQDVDSGDENSQDKKLK